jgi:hypothetical protein
MNYYLGGYYLTKLNKLDFGSGSGKIVSTCSTCINDSLLGSWSYSWAQKNNEDELEKIRLDYLVSDTGICEIHKWVDDKLEKKEIGWSDLFLSLNTLQEYKSKFFAGGNDLKIMSIYFNESGKEKLLEEFKPFKDNGSIGLYDGLTNKVIETEIDNEKLIGFDLIGIELSGNFHSFHCHDMSEDLMQKFGVTINSSGLIESLDDWGPIVKYMNSDENGFEPVAWFVVKVKEVVK